jgi:pimeloyl-ACP methyl ester carboxylesterase
VKSRIAVFALIATMVVSSVTGCQFLPTGESEPTGPAPTDRAGYYSQELTWRDCGDQVSCAKVWAPIDWAAPSQGSIELSLVKHSATGVSHGSLLVNPGGPGGSGGEWVYYGAESAATPAVVDSFDIIGWDPRGVGHSTPVVCYTNPKQQDALLYDTPDAGYDTQAWIDELTVVERRYAAACEKNTGELLGHIDTASNARDMDMLRAVLGERKLNYLGYSYGTYFGTVYAELFPERVGSFVLDGAIDPLLTDFESLKIQMAGFDSAFRAYMKSCLSTDEDCPFSGNLDHALHQARTILEEVDARALVNDDGRVLDSATLGTAIVTYLYSESSWDSISHLFSRLKKNDPAAAFEGADSYNGRDYDGTYYGSSLDVYTAVTCVDGDFVDDPATTLARMAQIDEAAPILGKYIAYDDFAVLDTACTHWPVAPADLPTSFHADGAGPILVIGTTNDPATPYAWAKSLASQLSSGVMVTHAGEGHTVYNQGVTCIDDVVDAYLLKGTVPDADPMC